MYLDNIVSVLGQYIYLDNIVSVLGLDLLSTILNTPKKYFRYHNMVR